MFNTNINSPVSPLTHTYVNKLTRIYNEPDYSLISLATAVIKPRVAAYSGIDGQYKFFASADTLCSEATLYNNARSEMTKDQTENIPGFCYFIITLDDKKMETVKSEMKKIGLTELTVVENFVRQQLNISNYGVFINSENNTAFVIVGSSQMALYHLSISFISLLYPALFKEHALSKEEMDVVKSLTNKSASNFIERVSAALEYMKPELMKEELAQCFKGFRQARIDRCESDLTDMQYQAERILEQYRSAVDRYNELLIQFEGLKVVNGDDRNSDEQETIDYICSCKQLHNVNYDSGNLRLCIDTLLTNFDMNKWKNAVKRCNIYDNYRLPDDSVFKDRSKRKLLFDNIFNVKPLLYVRVKSHVTLHISRCDMSAQRGQAEAENNAQMKDYITNPHFKIHGCPGRNREQIIRCLRQGDVISAIECSIAATGSVNIDETEYTFRPFLQEVLSSKQKILQNNKGEAMTPEEALLWLSKQDLKNEKEEKQVTAEEEIHIPF